MQARKSKQTRKRSETAHEGGPRERIVAAALELFYRRGYAQVSVDEVIERAGAYKKSFYRYFPAREDLGREYLQRQADFFFDFFDGMLARYEDFEAFLKAWMRILRREAREGEFTGCPFAQLATDVKGQASGLPEFEMQLKEIVARRRRSLAAYLKRCTYRGRPLPVGFPAQELADRIILMYQGGITIFAMSGDQAHIRGLEKEIAFVVDASVAAYDSAF